MTRGKWAAILITTLFVTSSVVFAGCLVFPALPMSVVVPDDFPTIQAAIGNCTEGSTIHVRNGIYNEPLIIDKPLTLIGENRQNTIIKGLFEKSTPSTNHTVYAAVNITANNVVLSNFNIAGSDTGVEIWSNNCQLIDNDIQTFDVGISNMGSNQVFSGNNVVGNTAIWGKPVQWGILNFGNATLISENSFENFRCGIYSFLGSNVTIEKNIVANGRFEGDSQFYSGITLAKGEQHKVYGNVLQNLNTGIAFEGASNSSVYNNTITQNLIGVKLPYYPLWQSTSGSNNLFFNNNIIDNIEQVIVQPKSSGYSTNEMGTDMVQWDNGVTGNYWSDYQAKYPNATQNSNETYDTPYVIDANNKDNHPIFK